MAKSANQKLKLLYLLQLFEQKTDGEHYVTMKDIIDYLEMHSIAAERKAVYTDIEALRAFGFDIKGVKMGREYKYCLVKGRLSVAELELLAAAVATSACITEEQAQALLGRLKGFTSNYNGKRLMGGVTVKNRNGLSGQLAHKLQIINSAMEQDKQLAFNYLQWNHKKELVPRKNPFKCGISPWAVVQEDGRLYLCAYEGAGDRLRYYSLDKLDKLAIDTDSSRQGAETFHAVGENSLKQSFTAPGGDACTVKLECKGEAVSAVVDRFGSQVSFVQGDEGSFTFNVDVVPGKQFFGWLFAMGNEVRVLAPKSVRRAFKDRVKEAAKALQ